MVELKGNSLVFSFPEVHAHARLSIQFQRTLRIPDDGKTHWLPPGLGAFPLRHVDDARAVPESWTTRGGVMLPMYQAEALWIHFAPAYVDRRQTAYPFAVKVAAGKVNAVTGDRWSEGLSRSPQDYLVAPPQPWLDGFCVEKGVIRQFVAMPLGEGYTAEEQVTAAAEYGGLQIAVFPMKRDVFLRRFPERTSEWVLNQRLMSVCEMGLAPGGRMRQVINEDPYAPDDWDQQHTSRCFVHIANSRMWRAYTGEAPPMRPPTAADYTHAGLPWFDYYSDGPALEGSGVLGGLVSVKDLGEQKGESPLPENESISKEVLVRLRERWRAHDAVRDGSF